jgi:endonuclease YncB( thermonuclease family)
MQLDDDDRAVLRLIDAAGSRGIKSRDLALKRYSGQTRPPVQTAQRLRSMKLTTIERAVTGDTWHLTERGTGAL